MSPPRLIVIGAGLAGLSAGVHAARCGYDVTILEHHDRPGGVCTAWQRGGYTIDGCIHWLMGSGEGGSMRRIYEEVGALEGVRLLPVRHFARLTDRAGHVLDVTADLPALAAQAAAISPEDGPLFRELVEAALSLRDFRQSAENAPELSGMLASLGQAWRMRRHLPVIFRYMTPVREFAERIRHPFLRAALPDLFLPEIPLMFGLVVLAELANGQLHRIEGGSHRFSRAIALRFAQLGGTIRYGSDVEEILVEDGAAAGARLTDGSELRADRVISAAPGHTTLFRMLGGRYTDERIRRRYAQWPVFEGIALVSFGARRAWPDRPPTTHILLDPPLLALGHPAGSVLVRNFTDDPTLSPAGGTVIQAMLSAPFELWHDLHHAPRRYAAAKEELAQAVLERIAPHFPGIEEQIELTDVATPYTFWRYARSWRGAFEGWLPTVEAVRDHLPKTLPGLRNFYMAGQWVEPGGGVPPAIYSGRHAVQLLCRADDRPFHSDDPLPSDEDDAAL